MPVLQDVIDERIHKYNDANPVQRFQNNTAAGSVFDLLYNTGIGTADYEKGGAWWSGNVFYIGTRLGGTGTNRSLSLSTPTVAGVDTARFTITSGATSALDAVGNFGVTGTCEFLKGSAVPQRLYVHVSPSDANVPEIYVDASGQMTLNAQGTYHVRFQMDKGGPVGIGQGEYVHLTRAVTANNDNLNAAPTATVLIADNVKSFVGIAKNISLPAITPVANGAGITLTGLSLAQGAISNVADSETITVKQVVITGAAGAALETGVYSWTGIDITTPAQAANGVANVGIGLKVTGGALAGVGGYQQGIAVTMAAATDDAIKITTGNLAMNGNDIDGAVLDTSVAKGTWTASGTWTLPAFTLGGAITGGGKAVSGLGFTEVAPTFTANNQGAFSITPVIGGFTSTRGLEFNNSPAFHIHFFGSPTVAHLRANQASMIFSVSAAGEGYFTLAHTSSRTRFYADSYLILGNDAITGHGLVAGDTLVAGTLEANGVFYADGIVELGSNVRTASILGVAATRSFDMPIGVGGAAAAELSWEWQIDSIELAGLHAETNGSGSYQNPVFMIPYLSADYGAAWGTAPTLPAGATNGAMVMCYNTNAGQLNSRLYARSNGAWVSVAIA